MPIKSWLHDVSSWRIALIIPKEMEMSWPLMNWLWNDYSTSVRNLCGRWLDLSKLMWRYMIPWRLVKVAWIIASVCKPALSPTRPPCGIANFSRKPIRREARRAIRYPPKDPWGAWRGSSSLGRKPDTVPALWAQRGGNQKHAEQDDGKAVEIRRGTYTSYRGDQDRARYAG